MFDTEEGRVRRYTKPAMRRTDYDTLAAWYDAPWRTNVPVDAILGERLKSSTHKPFRVLDVGCGTGAWLLSQSRAYAGTPAEFHGIEPSAGMLAIARKKGIPAELAQAGAEKIPYDDARFDFIITRLAYHHFEDKTKAFDEIVRVLKNGACFVISDMVPERMPDWVIYQFFPEAYLLDQERFLPLEQLQSELERRGCAVAIEMKRSEQKVDWKFVLMMAEGRGTSSLQILTDAEYQAGLRRAREEMARDPGRVIVDGNYAGNLVATKRA